MENVLETVFISLWLKDAKLEVLVAPSCLTLCNPMNYSQSGSSANGILQTGILERVAIPFFRGSFWLRDPTWVSPIVGRFFTIWVTKEAPSLWYRLAKIPPRPLKGCRSTSVTQPVCVPPPFYHFSQKCLLIGITKVTSSHSIGWASNICRIWNKNTSWDPNFPHRGFTNDETYKTLNRIVCLHTLMNSCIMP